MLFPNSRNNSKFMEQMMGVKKELSEEDINENLLEAEEKMSSWEKFRNRIEKLKAGGTLFLNMFLIENKAKKFYKLIDENLNGKNSRLEEKSVKDLKKYYKFLENKFLKNWEIPIINDFLVMVWFGLSKKVAEKYIKENFEEVHNILIAQEGNDMISVEPSKYIMKMSSIIKKDKDLQNEIKRIIAMAILQKIKETSTTDTYTITVESSIDMFDFKNTYSTMSPETDIIVQLLVYAHDNYWRINERDTERELMDQLENFLTEDEILNIELGTLKTKIEDIADELNSVAPKGIEYITLEKNGDKYKLDVTKDDIRKIFLDLI